MDRHNNQTMNQLLSLQHKINFHMLSTLKKKRNETNGKNEEFWQFQTVEVALVCLLPVLFVQHVDRNDWQIDLTEIVQVGQF